MIRALTVEQVRRVVCEVWGVTVRDLRSDVRQAELVRPRFALAWLARRHTEANYPTIARLMRRDHQTIMHAESRAAELLATDAAFAEQVAAAEITIAALHRLALIQALDGVDVVAVARRIDASPNRNAAAASVAEIAAMAAWIVDAVGCAEPLPHSPPHHSPAADLAAGEPDPTHTEQEAAHG